MEEKELSQDEIDVTKAGNQRFLILLFLPNGLMI